MSQLRRFNVSNNKIQGAVPAFNYSSGFSFDMQNNLFSCPLPQWCAGPPTGNGACSPCFSCQDL